MSDRSNQINTAPPLGKASKGNIILAGNSKVSLDIRVMDRYGYANTLSLQSFVEKVNHDSSFLIRMPVYQNSYYPLRSDEMCLMYFTIVEKQLERKQRQSLAAPRLSLY